MQQMTAEFRIRAQQGHELVMVGKYVSGLEHRSAVPVDIGVCSGNQLAQACPTHGRAACQKHHPGELFDRICLLPGAAPRHMHGGVLGNGRDHRQVNPNNRRDVGTHAGSHPLHCTGDAVAIGEGDDAMPITRRAFDNAMRACGAIPHRIARGHAKMGPLQCHGSPGSMGGIRPRLLRPDLLRPDLLRPST